MMSSHRNEKNVHMRNAKIRKTIHSNLKLPNLLDRALKLDAFPSFHHLITLAVVFIRNYSKFCAYICQILITFTPGNQFDLFQKRIKIKSQKASAL